MRKNNNGFTLVELLAVIVILGLLMAIAIPSVTKYITQSRKKTLVKTIDSYVNAVVTQVNDGEYKFSDSTKIFAIPIECISLEKGGSNPFGNWHQANFNYWAYVLVQYDNENYNYKYGFTFKDDAGYGMYPITIDAISEKGSQIQNSLKLKKPISGLYTNIAVKEVWNDSGFVVDDETRIVVLESAADGVAGDGIKTCTLCQKGNNYSEVEASKDDSNINNLPMLTSYSSDSFFWKYSTQIKTITFENVIDIPKEAYESWDVSFKKNGLVMAYISKNKDDDNYYDLYIQSNGKIYANTNASSMFNNFINLDKIINLDIVDFSKTTNMNSMFQKTGYNSKIFTLDLGDNFNISNVTNTSYMFFQTGYNSMVFTLDLGEKFNTSKVTSMKNMFQQTGYNSTIFKLDLGNEFDTSNVIDMSYMFSNTGYKSTLFSLDLKDRFDTSKVTNMQNMFYGVGYSSPIFTLNLGNKFDTSNVTNMANMFQKTGYSGEGFKLDLGNEFDTSKVITMANMFEQTGYNSKDFTLNLGNKFNTSNVTNMVYMFFSTGYKSSVFMLDCSNWSVGKVVSYNSFNGNNNSKVKAPIWVN